MIDTPAIIFLSDRSYCDILNETSQYLDVETGGVLIGECWKGKWFVLESIDPGPKAIRQHSYFEYDQVHVNHLSNKVGRRYARPPKLLGLWHRHPGSFDRFSGTDDGTHRRYIQQCNGPIISGLVNIDPMFRLTFCVVDGEPPRHQRTSYAVGDHHFPPDLLRTLNEETLMGRMNGAIGLGSRSAQELRVVDRPVDKTSASPTVRRRLLKSLGSIKKRLSWKTPPVDCPNPEDAIGGVGDGMVNVAIEMLDDELEFLDSQRDFIYELERTHQGVLLTMQKLSDSTATEKVRFLFTVEAQLRIVKHETQSYPFHKGIVEQLIGQRFY